MGGSFERPCREKRDLRSGSHTKSISEHWVGRASVIVAYPISPDLQMVVSGPLNVAVHVVSLKERGFAVLNV